jgi:hypothetical protein
MTIKCQVPIHRGEGGSYLPARMDHLKQILCLESVVCDDNMYYLKFELDGEDYEFIGAEDVVVKRGWMFQCDVPVQATRASCARRPAASTRLMLAFVQKQ